MNPTLYTRLALRTTTDRDPVRLALEVAAEAGEVAGVAAKAMRRGRSPDRDRIIDECGDVLWSVAVLLESVGSSLEEAMQRNVRKLEQRHKIGAALDAAVIADLETSS